jgi:hypothetical protein
MNLRFLAPKTYLLLGSLPRLSGETGDTVPPAIEQTLARFSDTRAQVVDLTFLADIRTKQFGDSSDSGVQGHKVVKGTFL